MENASEHRNVKPVTKEGRKLVSELNCHTTKFFTEYFSATEMRKTQMSINKPVYLGLST